MQEPSTQDIRCKLHKGQLCRQHAQHRHQLQRRRAATLRPGNLL